MSGTKQESKTGWQSRKANRLLEETSPYLLQHAYNPVDWYPWCQEALDAARKEDKPILLSIGYSACHWCHVMEHESFENEEIARLMNEYFVPIKVDREERPDLDEIYMKAVQLMTGHGGWPMTVFLTPDLRPCLGGTYYPPEDRHGMPGFKRLLGVIAEAWRDQRARLLESSDELVKHMVSMSEVERSDARLKYSLIEKGIDRILQVFDRQWGGLGGAPKFPQTFALSLAMRVASPASPAKETHRTECLGFITTTLDRMAYGGMQDQLGGGFARYSVDRYWRVPHFEKMLYDNATLAKTYLDGYLLVGRRYWLDVARSTLDFVLRELGTEGGAFYSSLDADSEGEEGKFYVWRPDEILSVLGKEDGAFFNDVYGVSEQGNFEHGTTVLHLSASPELLAEKHGIKIEDLWSKLAPLKEKLLAHREKRVRPGRDEKVLTSWNALMIPPFVIGYGLLGHERYLEAARKAASFILTELSADGRLLRTWGKGKAKLNGYLDDYAYTIEALLYLASVDFDPQWLECAAKLADTMISRFWDQEAGGFFYTSDDHEKLITRTKNFFDGSTPSGTSVAAMALLKLAAATGVASYREKAERLLQLYAPHADRAPDQLANLLCALDFYLAAGTEIVIAARRSGPDVADFVRAVHQSYLPNAVSIVKEDPEAPAKGRSAASPWLERSPLLKDRRAIDGKPTAYVCSNYTCTEPITDLAALAKKLAELSATAK